MYKVIISDSAWESHGVYIRNACKQGFADARAAYESYLGMQIPPNVSPLLTDDDFNNISDFNQAVEYCKTDSDVKILIRSTTGVASYVEKAKEIYPDVLTFFPLGSNTFENLTIFDDKEPPVIVITGAGDTENQNNTGWGNGLEFWDDDLDLGTPDLSSYSNGYIAGKLFFISQAIMYTEDSERPRLWVARWRARITASRTEITRLANIWDSRNGYGKIDIVKAITYDGIIPFDPYLEPNIFDLYNTLLNDYADLESENESLTSENLSLTTQLSEANEQLAEFIFTQLIKGYSTTKVTVYGTALVAKIRDVEIKDSLVRCKVDYHINEAALDLTPLATESFEFYERNIIDYVYKNFLANQEISENNLIIES